ncbi:MAG TPA: GNAT family N-acetyltransferase [Jiangellaceae bacterium]|nr:GNAT family N-acetyltransferase [Jiangellaceae bacterium]
MTRPTIRPMTAAEQQAYAATVADGYFRQRFEFGNEPEHVARAHTAEAMDRLWPGGRPAPGNYVFAAEVDGVVVGSLWLAEQSPGGPEDQGWIYDVQVVPDQRGKGYGRALVQAAEAKAGEFGCTALGLNVFGGNEIAISLYQSLGFQATSIQMAKQLVTD